MTPNIGRVTLKQGGGGRAMRALIEKLFIREFAAMPFNGVGLGAMDDGAAIPIGDQFLIVTTDSHVIHPIFFPGGDIGRISISGTVNDLAMMGATQLLGITCGVILEEGFPLDQLESIQRSLVDTCLEAGTVVNTVVEEVDLPKEAGTAAKPRQLKLKPLVP